ncbi:MAG: FAD-dependent oxidoreductase [Clostridiales bacterium]|nr:FAD-dependent oxidoreductase [Clostridiales bacterium]
MSHVLIVGGGLAGCTTAKELADNGAHVTIVEAAGGIGGKVRGYGCKATDVCNNCGVCLAAGLWDRVEQDADIEILGKSKLIDLSGKRGGFTAAVKSGAEIRSITDITEVVVATGFEQTSLESGGGFVEIDGRGWVITGSELERICKGRGAEGKEAAGLFEEVPASVAFIQCYGSRDCKENAMYCSKVCCAYSTRAAKVIRHYYPECKITFFYMELQMVNGGNYFQELKGLGVEFIKCRPVSIDGAKGAISFDDPVAGRRESRRFDVIVLSDGIHPTQDAGRLAEICGLSRDKAGFLKYTSGPSEAGSTGVFLAGCAGGPKKIEEVFSEAVSVAREIATA